MKVVLIIVVILGMVLCLYQLRKWNLEKKSEGLAFASFTSSKSTNKHDAVEKDDDMIIVSHTSE